MSHPANWDPDVSQQLALGVGAGSTISGDVGGALPGPTTVTGIQGIPVSPTPPTNGQELVYVAADGQWEPKSEAAGTSPVGLELTKLGTVLSPGPATFDAGMVESPSVWWDEPSQRYGMVYTGYNAAISASAIGLAWSEDGVTWTKDGASPILSGSGSGFDSVGCTSPVMYWEAGTYFLFYAGLTATGYEGGTPSIGLATFTTMPGTPTRLGQVIPNSGAGWRANATFHSSIVKVGTTYYNFFNARSGAGVESIGYATSTNLTSWTVDDVNSPMISPAGGSAWDSWWVADPSVFRLGDVWFMGYAGSQTSYTPGCDGYAWTTAAAFPLGWTRWTYNPVLSPDPIDSNFSAKPYIVLTQSQLLHYYTSVPQPHSVIGLAVSDLPVPTSTAVSGVKVTGVPSAGQTLTAISATEADWQAIPTPVIYSPLTDPSGPSLVFTSTGDVIMCP